LLADWPLLLFVTMRKQVLHMRKHKHLPWINFWKKYSPISPEHRAPHSKSNRR
jgi:hypothetical protein